MSNRATRFLEMFGSLDRKPLAQHDLASPRMGSNDAQHDLEVPVRPPHQSGNMPDDTSIYDDNGAIDSKRVIQNLTQRLALLNIRGISVDNVEADNDEGSIFVSFSDNEGNGVEVEFCYDDNDQATAYVDDQENPLGPESPSAITTALGKFINLYDPLFGSKEMYLTLFTQGGIYPTKDRLSLPGRDAFGNRSSAPQT